MQISQLSLELKVYHLSWEIGELFIWCRKKFCIPAYLQVGKINYDIVIKWIKLSKPDSIITSRYPPKIIASLFE